MAKPGEQNFTYTEGDDELYVITLIRQSDQAPIDLTGATVAAEIRDDYASAGGVVIATATCTVTSPTSGQITVALAAADTKLMGGATFKYDVQVTIGGKKRTFLRGELIGTKEVTDL